MLDEPAPPKPDSNGLCSVENLYDVLALVVGNCYHVPVVAGDLNASLGSRLLTDDVETLCFCGVGVGARNESG